MDDCGDDCNCAVCSTLVMGPNPEWKPVLVAEVMIRRCCFCRGDKQVHHLTALAMPVCGDCATQFEPVTPEPPVEYSVKIWYRSGAYEGMAHSPEDLARQIFADAVKSAGVEFAELHGPSGKLVESKVPHPCNAVGDAINSLGTERCELPTGHGGRHYEGNTTWPNRGA